MRLRLPIVALASTLLVALAPVVQAAPPAAAPPAPVTAPRFAYVDMERLINQVAEGQALAASNKKWLEDTQKWFDTGTTRLKNEADSLGKSKEPTDIQRQKESELTKKTLQLQQDYQRKLDTRRIEDQAARQAIRERAERVVASVAASEGFSWVFDKSAGLVCAPSSADLTQLAIKAYDQAASGPKPSAPPGKK